VVAIQGDAAATRAGRGEGAAGRAADWLCLAAAPTFAMMALMTSFVGAPDILCSIAHGPVSLGGMVPMYLLMSGFHLAPWLKLIAGRRSGARRS
jgi:hypothetical protein